MTMHEIDATPTRDEMLVVARRYYADDVHLTVEYDEHVVRPTCYAHVDGCTAVRIETTESGKLIWVEGWWSPRRRFVSI